MALKPELKLIFGYGLICYASTAATTATTTTTTTTTTTATTTSY